MMVYNRSGTPLGPMCMRCGGTGVLPPFEMPPPPPWIKLPGDSTSARLHHIARLRSVLWAVLLKRVHPPR